MPPRRSLNAGASTSKSGSSSKDKALGPLDALDTPRVSALKSIITTSHFGWPPEHFVKQGMDVANGALYEATALVEDRLKARLGEQQDEEDEAAVEQIEQGMVKLETLLENAVDRSFDLFELYLLRNTFHVDTDLIPYITLEDQDGLDEGVKGQDEEVFEEYIEELRLYRAELEKQHYLRIALEAFSYKVDDLLEKEAQTGSMAEQSGLLNKKTQKLISSVAPLRDQVSALLDAATPPRRALPGTASFDRAQFLNSAASSKVASAAGAGPGSSAAATTAKEGETSKTDQDETMKRVAEDTAAIGSADAVESLLP